jgi:lipopolysaccharide/colanic/teichoic acid biosynthesis glycosyltransferase
MQAVIKPLGSRLVHRHERSSLNRIFDCAIAGLLIALTLPLLAFVSLVIKIETGGPVLVQEQRVTRSGRRMPVLRFRSHRWRRCGPTRPWRREQTRSGRFVTYTGISNLPQLLNVLRGEWSLINPRTERPNFFD